MRKSLIVLIVLLASFYQSSFGQEQQPATNHPSPVQTNSIDSKKETFYLTGTIPSDKREFYMASIAKADMESYRLREKEVVIEFKEGFKCVLPSAKQLIIKGYQIDPNAYKTDFDKKFVMPVFKILADGHLVAEYEKVFK
jgi:hypothetical protein